MEIHEDTLKKIMQMSYLEVEPQEKRLRQEELSEMVVWVKRLLEVDTRGVDPLATLSSEVNRLRADVPEDPLSQEGALCNSSDAVEPYFSVPTIKV